MKQQIPNPNGQVPHTGMKVYIPAHDAIGEVVEISNDVKGLITKVKVSKDGGFDVIEVADLVIKGLSLLAKIKNTKLGKWFIKLFKRKNKK